MPDDQDRDQRAHARVGSVLNEKWKLERLIGIGGMAAVYAGLHRNGARAAVKVLHADIARIPQVRERFLREGYAANRVEHGGAVKVLDDDVIASGADEGAAYLVMELLEGHSLEDRIARGPRIGEKELLVLARSVLGVLEAAHAHGVVHRDLKPENLFLPDPEPGDELSAPRVKILDFGLARVADARLRTMHGLAVGTPSYMPPEQAAGRVDEIDGRCDLFSLGATCFRILAGRTVHPGTSPIEIAVRMAKDPAPKIRTVAPAVSEATAEVIDRALEFRREDRWPDAAAMRAAVDRALEKLAQAPALPPPRPARAEPAPKPPPKIASHSSIDGPGESAGVLLARPPIDGPEESAGVLLARPPIAERLVVKRRRSLIPIVTIVFLLLVGAKVAQEELGGRGLSAGGDAEAESSDAGVLEDGSVSEVSDAGVDLGRTRPAVRPTRRSHSHSSR